MSTKCNFFHNFAGFLASLTWQFAFDSDVRNRSYELTNDLFLVTQEKRHNPQHEKILVSLVWKECHRSEGLFY